MDFKRIAAAAALVVAIAAPTFAKPAQAEQVYRHRYDSGFWPADAAAGIVGGAIGTAGAIAAAPFGAGPYAYYGHPYYAAPNGFVCEPGTRFRGEDGLIHRCR
jgi:hypothetical protein